MIYPYNNIITYMNILDGSHGKIFIEELLTKYFHESDVITKDELEMICFDRGNILIKDWDGWTELRSINKRKIKDSDEFFSISLYSNPDDFIIVERNKLIPIFTQSSIDNPIKIFHGGIKYEKINKLVTEINDEDSIKVYDKLKYFQHPIIKKVTEIKRDVFLYNVITKSGYFNLSNFYLF